MLKSELIKKLNDIDGDYTISFEDEESGDIIYPDTVEVVFYDRKDRKEILIR